MERKIWRFSVVKFEQMCKDAFTPKNLQREMLTWAMDNDGKEIQFSPTRDWKIVTLSTDPDWNETIQRLIVKEWCFEVTIKKDSQGWIEFGQKVKEFMDEHPDNYPDELTPKSSQDLADEYYDDGGNVDE